MSLQLEIFPDNSGIDRYCKQYKKESPICQKYSVRDATLFEQIKNANFSDLSLLIRNCKSTNILQQSNSPDVDNKRKQLESVDGKENTQFNNGKPSKNSSQMVEISQILEMSICETKSSVDFGSSLPGYVLEESLVLTNLTSVPFSVKVTVLCFDEELNALDEYVFSVRKEYNYEYNENQVCKIVKNGQVKLFVALKAPNLKNGRKILGVLQIRVNGVGVVNGMLEKEIQAVVKVPKVLCLKELYSSEYNESVIKLAMKMNNGRADCKIPFKNEMSYLVKAEFELIYKRKSGEEYEFAMNPEFGILQPNAITMLVIVGKKNETKRREGMKQMLANQLDKITEKKQKEEKGEKNAVLLIKIVHSSLIMCFPMIIEMY